MTRDEVSRKHLRSATSVSVYRLYIKGGREGRLACLAAGNGAASTTHSSAGLFLFSAVFMFGHSATLKDQDVFYSPCSFIWIYLNYCNFLTKKWRENPDLHTHKCTFIATETSIVYPFVRVENMNLSSF